MLSAARCASCCDAALMSTLTLLMRSRFFFSPRCCITFSSRSLRFSSFVFFFGRVLWLSASRSIRPSTFTFVAFRIFFSLLVVNMFVEALVPSAVLCLAEASFFSGSVFPTPGSFFTLFFSVFFTSITLSVLFFSVSSTRVSAAACGAASAGALIVWVGSDRFLSTDFT